MLFRVELPGDYPGGRGVGEACLPVEPRLGEPEGEDEDVRLGEHSGYVLEVPGTAL